MPSARRVTTTSTGNVAGRHSPFPHQESLRREIALKTPATVTNAIPLAESRALLENDLLHAAKIQSGTRTPKKTSNAVSMSIDEDDNAKKSRNCCRALIDWLNEESGENLLLFLTLLGVFIGICIGAILRNFELSDQTELLIKFPGEILMNILKCLIMPLIMFSLISSISQLDPVMAGKIGYRSLLWYTMTAIMAMVTSVIIVSIIQPGYRVDEASIFGPVKVKDYPLESGIDTILDIFRQIFMENVFQATIEQVETKLENISTIKIVSMNETKTLWNIKRTLIYNQNPNVLGIVTFCIAFAYCAAFLRQKTVINLFIGLEAIIVKIMSTVMWYLPFGICSLMAGQLIEINNISSVATALGWWLLSTNLALFLHFFVTLPIAFWLVTKRNPYKFDLHMLSGYVNVIGHSSSSAALPITTHCLTTHNKVNKNVSRFCLTLGATINVDGAALYEAMAVIFIAQIHRMPFGFWQTVAVIVSVTLSSVGSSAMPGGGLIPVLPIIAPIDVTPADIALLMAVDWLVDRFRTCNNILGDAYTAAVVHEWCKRDVLRDVIDEAGIVASLLRPALGRFEWKEKLDRYTRQLAKQAPNGVIDTEQSSRSSSKRNSRVIHANSGRSRSGSINAATKAQMQTIIERMVKEQLNSQLKK